MINVTTLVDPGNTAMGALILLQEDNEVLRRSPRRTGFLRRAEQKPARRLFTRRSTRGVREQQNGDLERDLKH